MKELTRILWILLIQYIACRLAGWETSVTLLTLALLIIWQSIFARVNYVIRQQKNTLGKKDVTPVMYMVLSVPALFFPLLSVLIFCSLSVYRVCTIGCVTVGDSPFKEKFVFDHQFQCEPFPYESESKTEITVGLPMCGSLEAAGNVYGVWHSSSLRNSTDS